MTEDAYDGGVSAPRMRDGAHMGGNLWIGSDPWNAWRSVRRRLVLHI